jgi:threonine dehydrogenase-like Zn-dependent dehydrogenase
LTEIPVPELTAGMVRVSVRASLVSPGTEVGGWRGLATKYEQAGGSPVTGASRPFGYSVSGVVEESLPIEGEAVPPLPPGTRVAAIGAGYAMHSDVVVVPHNLCIVVPDGVTHDEACYAMLLATALHASRRGTPQMGEFWVVFGLGLVGLLTARLLELSGCYVSGVDASGVRAEFADRWLRSATPGEKPLSAFTTPADAESVLPALLGQPDRASGSGIAPRFDAGGFDGAVLAFGGEADAAVNQAVRLMKKSPDGHPYGTIVPVGWPRFSYTDDVGAMNNIDLRRASRTGPGYHDERWERGEDYPPVFMRWTTRTNLALSMELLRLGRIDVGGLTTHTIPLEDLPQEMRRIMADPDNVLGVVFRMGADA